MAALKNKIDFALVFSVKNANPNGDPLNGNIPRTTLDGYGELSDVCLKRKIRNRLQDAGENIFVQSDDYRKDDYPSLRSRAEAAQEPPADLARAGLTSAQTAELGRALLELKLALAQEDIQHYKLKIRREGRQVTITAT